MQYIKQIDTSFPVFNYCQCLLLPLFSVNLKNYSEILFDSSLVFKIPDYVFFLETPVSSDLNQLILPWPSPLKSLTTVSHFFLWNFLPTF